MVRLRTQKLNLKKVWNKFKKVVDNKKWGDNIRDVAKTGDWNFKGMWNKTKYYFADFKKRK